MRLSPIEYFIIFIIFIFMVLLIASISFPK